MEWQTPDISFNLTCAFMATNCHSSNDFVFVSTICARYIFTVAPFFGGSCKLDYSLLPFKMIAVLWPVIIIKNRERKKERVKKRDEQLHVLSNVVVSM